ncbi:MAG: hypothetical protein HYZ88_00170 [Candidatus Omnitrophica bacterium]|nr:hypothetical protein [Candidatus Omnitrophota bacterium]
MNNLTSARKHPSVALLLSLALPGLGQLYNGQRVKGLVIADASLGLGIGALWLSGLSRISAVLALGILWLSAALDAYKTAQASGQPLDWYYRPPYVIAMLLLVGPLALPLLWRSPYFARVARWGWTALVVAALGLFLVMPYLLARLLEQMPELGAILRDAGITP